MSDFNGGGATLALGLELWGESPGLARVVYPCKRLCFYVFTMLKALLGMLGLILQGETQDSVLGWLDMVMATLEHRSLPEGVTTEERRHPCGVMTWSLSVSKPADLG